KPPEPDQAWQATSAAWDQAVPKLSGTIADRDARHAYAVMRGLTSSDGGMAAAATMSLPERAKQGRNYDYRYAWIRDPCFSGLAGRRSGRRGDQGTKLRSRRRDLGTGRPALGAFPADLRSRPAGRRRGGPGGPGRGLERVRGRAARRRHGRLPASLRPLAAGARRRPSGRRAAVPGPARGDTTRGSAGPGHLGGGANRTVQRRVPVPVPP